MLPPLPIDAIYCGPLERVCETAAPLARNLGLPVEIAPDFDEIEMGDWTNRSVPRPSHDSRLTGDGRLPA